MRARDLFPTVTALVKDFQFGVSPVNYSDSDFIQGHLSGSGMKPKVQARAVELNAEPELFQFKANITYLIKSKAQKCHILRNQHKNLRKIMIYESLTPFVYYLIGPVTSILKSHHYHSHECGNNRLKMSFCID